MYQSPLEILQVYCWSFFYFITLIGSFAELISSHHIYFDSYVYREVSIISVLILIVCIFKQFK